MTEAVNPTPRRKPLRANAKPLWLRYYAKIDLRGSSDCWNWTGARNGSYGSFHLWWNPEEGRRRTVQAHRLGWFLTYLEWPPESMDINHICQNSLCQNIHHMELLPKTEHGRISAKIRWDEGQKERKNYGT